jgi:hypothetical protein
VTGKKWCALRLSIAKTPHCNGIQRLRELPREFSRLDGPGSTLYAELVAAAVRAACGLEDPGVVGEDGPQALQSIFALYRASETGLTQV